MGGPGKKIPRILGRTSVEKFLRDPRVPFNSWGGGEGRERGRRLDPGQLVPDACRPEAEAKRVDAVVLVMHACS